MLKPFYYYLPNLVSVFRILLVPVLLYFALNQQPTIFIIVLILTVLTDALDGFLARQLKAVSELGAQLDSWGDFLVYITMAIGAWLLWPDILIRKQLYIIIVIISFILPVLVGLIKYRIWTSYHTLSVKVAVVVSITAYILLFTQLLEWPIILAAIFSLYAGIEQILITLISSQKRTIDVKSIWHALQKKNK